MARTDTENLFRRYKGKLVVVKSVSGSEYQGHVEEITNDYVLLTAGGSQTFVVYDAIESIVVTETAN